MQNVFFLVLVFFANSLWAAKIEFSGTPVRTITANGVEIPIYSEGVVTYGDGTTPQTVYLTGAGVYVKKIVFIDEEIYVVQSFLDNPAGITTEDPMDSIRGSGLRVLYLNILTDLKAGQILSHFEDGLDFNDVDLTDPGVMQILGEFDFDLDKPHAALLVGYSNGTLPVLEMTVPTKTFSAEFTNLSDHFWKIWFGSPMDTGLARLKVDLTKK